MSRVTKALRNMPEAMTLIHGSQLLLFLLCNMSNLNHINFLNYIVNFRNCQEMLHEIDNLLAPPSPIMIYVMPPVVYPGRDILLLEQGFHLTGTAE